MRRSIDIDSDGDITTKESGGAELAEAFLNDDLISDFIETYNPGTRYNWTHIFTRAQLRNMFGAHIDMNTLDPLNEYILALRPFGFREQVSPTGDPCLYVVEKEVPYVEEADFTLTLP